MAERRRSFLQIKILLQLGDKPAGTVTELAQRVGSQRPSASRSLQILKEQGLVSRSRGGWNLTEDGKVEVAAEKARLAELEEKMRVMVRSTAEALGRVMIPTEALWSSEAIRQAESAIKPFAGLSERWQSLLSEAMRPIAALSSIASPGNLRGTMQLLQGLSSNPTAIIDRSVASYHPLETLGVAIRPLLEAQQRNTALVQDLTSKAYSAGIEKVAMKANFLEAQMRNTALVQDLTSKVCSMGIEEVARKTNLLLANAIDNVLAIRQAEAAKLAGRLSVDFSWLSADLAHVNQAFGQLFEYQTKQIKSLYPTVPLSQWAERITLPAVTAAHYTGAARDLVEAETIPNIPPPLDEGVEEFGDQELDHLLSRFNPDFVEMRHGSWSALKISGPDRLRHASISQRELLTQLLESLAPSKVLPEDKREGPQVKIRVRIALEASDSNAEFIGAVCEAIFSYYKQLNKYTHHNQKHEESLRALLHTGEGLIRFILANANNERTV